jgi:hypothetical protein
MRCWSYVRGGARRCGSGRSMCIDDADRSDQRPFTARGLACGPERSSGRRCRDRRGRRDQGQRSRVVQREFDAACDSATDPCLAGGPALGRRRCRGRARPLGRQRAGRRLPFDDRGLASGLAGRVPRLCGADGRSSSRTLARTAPLPSDPGSSFRAIEPAALARLPTRGSHALSLHNAGRATRGAPARPSDGRDRRARSSLGLAGGEGRLTRCCLDREGGHMLIKGDPAPGAPSCV